MKHLLPCWLLALVLILLAPLVESRIFGQTVNPDSTSWNPSLDPNYNPNDPSTWPPSYNPSTPGSLSMNPDNVPDIQPNGETVGDDGSSGSSSFGSFAGNKVTTYADRVKDKLESLIGEYEEQILGGLTDALEGFLMSQLQSLLGASPIRSVEALKKLMKDAYTKQQKIDYQQLKVDFAEQKGNTELSAGFADYYKTMQLKEHAQTVDYTISKTKEMVNTNVFTATEKTQLQATLSELTDMSDIVNEVRFVTNHSTTTAYMSEADRIRTLDDAYKRILKREARALAVKSKIRAVYVQRLHYQQRGVSITDMLGDADQGGTNGPLRVRRIY